MIRTRWEDRIMSGPRCRGECVNVLGKLTFVSKHFSDGFSRCRVCECWLDWRFCHLSGDEKATSKSRGMYCNCCNYQVRQRPHSREAKENLQASREQPLSSKKDNYNKPKLRSEELEIKLKQDNKKFSEIRKRMYDSLSQRQGKSKTTEPDKHIELDISEKSLDEIREYFTEKFLSDPSLLEQFEILENYLILLPKNKKYNIKYFL